MPVDSTLVSQTTEDREAHLASLNEQLEAKGRAIVTLAIQLSEAREENDRCRRAYDGLRRRLQRADQEGLRLEKKLDETEKLLKSRADDCANYAGRIFERDMKIKKLEGRLARARRRGR